MLYSRTSEERKIDFFVSLLRHVINGDQAYVQLVNPIIADIHALSIGQKNYFTVDRDAYPVIVFLAHQNKNYFAGLDPDNLTLDNYQTINSMLQQQRTFALA